MRSGPYLIIFGAVWSTNRLFAMEPSDLAAICCTLAVAGRRGMQGLFEVALDLVGLGIPSLGHDWHGQCTERPLFSILQIDPRPRWCGGLRVFVAVGCGRYRPSQGIWHFRLVRGGNLDGSISYGAGARRSLSIPSPPGTSLGRDRLPTLCLWRGVGSDCGGTTTRRS